MARTASTKRARPRNPETKLAHRRLTVLELAERLGNVSEACRRGELLSADTFMVGTLKGIGRVYLHAVGRHLRLLPAR